jgi:hypothetical protein
VNVRPPSVDFHVTTVGTITMSGFVGCTRTSVASLGLASTRGSLLTRVHVSPASSDR